MSFAKSVNLTHIFCQAGDDPEQEMFRDMLLRLRSYETTTADYHKFQTRFWSRLSEAEKSRFNNALHLLPQKDQVRELNLLRLSNCGSPVVRCKAKHNCADARKASEEDAEGLEKEIMLAEGATVMITRNLWTSKGLCSSTSNCYLLNIYSYNLGLVNGARGIVQKILYHPSANPQQGDLPAVVLVEVDKYSGMFFFACILLSTNYT